MPKQIEALNLLLTQDLEKGNNEISSAMWSAPKGKDYVEEIIVPTEQKSWQQALGDNPLVNLDNRLTLNKQATSPLHLVSCFSKKALMCGC